MMDIIKLCMIKIVFWDAVLKYMFILVGRTTVYVGTLPEDSIENRNLSSNKRRIELLVCDTFIRALYIISTINVNLFKISGMFEYIYICS